MHARHVGALPCLGTSALLRVRLAWISHRSPPHLSWEFRDVRRAFGLARLATSSAAQPITGLLARARRRRPTHGWLQPAAYPASENLAPSRRRASAATHPTRTGKTTATAPPPVCENAQRRESPETGQWPYMSGMLLTSSAKLTSCPSGAYSSSMLRSTCRHNGSVACSSDWRPHWPPVPNRWGR